MSCLIHPLILSAILWQNSGPNASEGVVPGAFFKSSQHTQPARLTAASFEKPLWDSSDGVMFQNHAVGRRDVVMLAWQSSTGLMIGALLRTGLWDSPVATSDAEAMLFRLPRGREFERARCFEHEHAYNLRRNDSWESAQIQFGYGELTVWPVSRRFSSEKRHSIYRFQRDVDTGPGVAADGTFSRIMFLQAEAGRFERVDPRELRDLTPLYFADDATAPARHRLVEAMWASAECGAAAFFVFGATLLSQGLSGAVVCGAASYVLCAVSPVVYDRVFRDDPYADLLHARARVKAWGGGDGRGRLVLVGNPGCGKSALLNMIAGEAMFASGVTRGAGLTQRTMQRASLGNARLVDTPGLADIGGRAEPSREIARALFDVDAHCDRLVLVVLMQTGRVAEADVDLLRIVLRATGNITYGLAVNRASPAMAASIAAHGVNAPQFSVLLASDLPRPHSVFAVPEIGSLADANDGVAPAPAGFFEWLDSLPARGGAVNNAQTLDARTQDEVIRDYEAKAADLRAEMHQLKKVLGK